MAARINRRSFLRWAGAGAASLAAPRLGLGAGEKRPDVLFLAFDDLNDWIGCLGGHGDAKTPHFDALAKRGMLFTNAHCAAPLCNASRAALMSGIRPATSGVYLNPQPWRPVMKDVVTLPQHFMAHGYKAIGSGKIYHGAFPDASMAFADACLGRVLEALDSGPYAKDTIIVLWGDHGWHLGEKLHWRKFTLWEEATRCPLMVVAPGVTRPGGVCRKPVNLLDIYPTLVDLCGLKPNRRLEGRSLLPLLKDPDAEWDRPSLCTYQRGNHSLRDERWRYIRYRDGSEELYDHGRDEMEWTNLAGETRYDDVKKRLGKWLPKSDAPDAPRAKRRGGKGKTKGKKAKARE